MKVIDILNKIAKGEEVRFRVIDDIDYYCKVDELLHNKYGEEVEWMIDSYWLNKEVEIIEEKKIPEKLPIGLKQTKDGIFNTIVKDDIQYELNEKEVIICKKIHEIIDYLDYLKSKGE